MMLSRIDAAEQKIVLQHHAEALAQMPQIDLAQIRAVDLHEAAVVAVDPLQQAGDRRLARAAAADDAEHGAGGHREAHPVERRHLGAGIGEGDVLEADGAGKFRPHAAGRRVDLERAVEHRSRFADRGADLLVILDQPRQADERLRHALRSAS